MEEKEDQKPGANAGAENTESVGANGQGEQEQKTNVQIFDELLGKDKKYQAEFDRRVEQAIETAKTKWKEIMDTEKSEAEKLAKMNKEQKLEYQAEKEKKEKEEALAKVNAYEMKEQAIKIASEKGLDISLLTFFDFKTVKAEELNNKIEEVSTVFKKAVENAVNEKLKEKTPHTQYGGVADSQRKDVPRASY